MAASNGSVAPFKNSCSVSLPTLEVDGKERLVVKVPKFLNRPRLTETDTGFERREADGAQSCMKFFVRGIVGDSSEMSLVGLKRMYFHDIVDQWQCVSKSRPNHLYECANGRHSRDDMSPSRVCICCGDNRPRKGQETFKGVKKMAPGPFIPVPECMASRVSSSKAHEHVHLPGYSIELKISHIRRVHLSSIV
jgi:hypothetical protein